MIHVILFDLGNVLLPVDGHRMARSLSKHTALSPDDILKHFGKHEIINEFESGRMKPEMFYNHISEACQLDGLEFEDFLIHFNDIFEEDASMISLLAKLKRNHKLGMISNTNEIHTEHMLKTYDLFKQFDYLWFSHEAGLRKPDAAIYKLALDHFNVPAENTVFIDDLPMNVEGAKKIGIQALLFQGYDKLVADLQALGVGFSTNGGTH